MHRWFLRSHLLGGATYSFHVHYLAAEEHGKKLAVLFSIMAKFQAPMMVMVDPDNCSGTNSKSVRAVLSSQLPYAISLEISDLALR